MTEERRPALAAVSTRMNAPAFMGLARFKLSHAPGPINRSQSSRKLPVRGKAGDHPNVEPRPRNTGNHRIALWLPAYI